MYAVLYAHSYSKVIYVVIACGWLLCCHDNGNVGLHIHDHTYTVLYAHSKGIKVIYNYSHHLRLVAIGYVYAILP